MGIQGTILKKKFMLLKSLTLIVLTWWDFADHVGMPFILVIGQRALHEYSPITKAFDVHFLSIVGQLHTFTCSKGTIKIHTETRDLGEREREEREIEIDLSSISLIITLICINIFAGHAICGFYMTQCHF